MITAGDIKVRSRFPIASIADMEMEVREGSHGKVILRGYLTGEEMEAGQLADDSIVLSAKGKDGQEEALFCGIIQEAYIFHENGVKQAILTAVSASAKMDRQKCSRSFQDTSMPCTKILQSIAVGYGGELRCEDTPVKIGKPMVQYEETDWEFCRRVAGRMGQRIFCNPSCPEPVLEAGLVEGRRVDFPADRYRCCVDGEYYRQRNGGNTPKAEFLYYLVESEENYAVGDSARYKGQKRYIFEKRAELKDGILQFSYKLGGRCRFLGGEQPNRKIAGVSLQGEVERTEGESVYIKLDIDGSGGKAAHPYPWAPATGSLMYCMPQPGTRACVYFPDCDEANAEAVSSVRSGKQCPEFCDTQRRELATEHGKQLRMYADGIYFQNERGEAGQRFMLGQRSLALEAGTGRLAVTGKEGVTFRAPFVRVATPREISQYKMERYAAQKEEEIRPKGSRNPATGGNAGFSMQYEFNGMAGQGILAGSEYERYLPFEDEPAYEKDCATWLKMLAGAAVAVAVGVLVGVAVGALAVCCAPLAAVVAAAGITALGAGVIAGVITAGAGIAAAAATCAHDEKNGTVSSLGDYVYNSFTASTQVGGAVVAVCMSFAAADVLTIMATGGLPVIPGITVPITAQQIWGASSLVFLGFTVKNLDYQLQDVRNFVVDGKPLGAPTGDERYDTGKVFVETVANMALYLGIQDPYIYMKPTISPLPDELPPGAGGTVPTVPGSTGSAVPSVSGSTAGTELALQGEVMVPVSMITDKMPPLSLIEGPAGGEPGNKTLSTLLGVRQDDEKINWEAHNVVNYMQLKEQYRVCELANNVVDSIVRTGRLPSYYITKSQARAMGWSEGKALNNYAPGKALGGDVFANTGDILPSASGRIWYEADVGIDYSMSRSNPKNPTYRILYSNDGLIYGTYDHYDSVFQIYP